MGFDNVLTSPNPEPGELFEALERDLTEDNGFSVDRDPVDTLSEQKDLVNSRLPRYLEDLSRSKGAKKVVEEFYREQHGKEIDATDVDELMDEVPDLSSIISDRKLPWVSKGDLRERYHVGGFWGTTDVDSHLSPSWVRSNNSEPAVVSSTGGTTGEPWYRPMTRNDFALFLSAVLENLHMAIQMAGGSYKDTRYIITYPNWHREEDDEYLHRKITEYTEGEVVPFDFSKLKPGETEKADEAIQYINGGEFTVVWCPATFLTQGKMGVAIRRGEVDIDVVVNSGSPVTELVDGTLSRSDIPYIDLYGETEYPQGGGVYKEELDGYDLPFTSQVNLIYDEDSGELSYEGTGRFAYFPFGAEGQIIPGVYLSGVQGELEIVDDSHQVLRDVERVVEVEGGCADV